MTENYKILGRYIKDMSSETPNVETFLFVKDNLSKYQLNIDITSKALKDKIVEINTTLKFEDKEARERKSFFEIVYATIIKVSDEIKEKEQLQKIILCDVQKEIYPNLETSFINLLTDSGYPGIKLDKKIDFDKLYNQKFN
jgi:preprotein translocase subunit SecB